MANQFPQSFDCVIASGQTASTVVNMQGHTLIGLEIPAAFDGATLTVKASIQDAASVANVYDSEGNQMIITVTADPCFIPLLPSATHAFRYVQLVAGSSQATTDTLIKLIYRNMA